MSRFIAVEFTNDATDHRPLGTSGEFLSGTFGEQDVASFPSAAAAEGAVARATNRRENTTVSVLGQMARRAA